MDNNFLNQSQNPYTENEQVGETFVSPTFNPIFEESAEETEKKAIKKKMNGIGFVLIIMFVFMRLWIFPFIIIAQYMGFSYGSVYALLENEYFLNTMHIALSSLCFTVPFIILAKVQKRTVSGLVPLGKAKEGTALPFFLLGISMSSVANMFSSAADSFFDNFLSFFGLKYDFPSDTADEKGLIIFILSLLSTAVVPALVEEFGCRGIMFGLLKEHSEGFAIIVTAILFAVIHGNFVQIPFAFMMGLALAVIRLKTGTLWVCVAVHFCNNLVSVIFDYVLYDLSQSLQNTIYSVYLAVCLLVGIIGILLIKNESSEIFKLEGNKNGIPEKSLVKTALTRPTVIIIASICLLAALSFISA